MDEFWANADGEPNTKPHNNIDIRTTIPFGSTCRSSVKVLVFFIGIVLRLLGSRAIGNHEESDGSMTISTRVGNSAAPRMEYIQEKRQYSATIGLNRGPASLLSHKLDNNSSMLGFREE